MRTVGFFVSILIFAALRPLGAVQTSFACADHRPQAGGAAKSLATAPQPLASQGSLHALVVFAQFNGEGAGPPPAWAADLFDPDRPGSPAHFYPLRALSGTAPRALPIWALSYWPAVPRPPPARPCR